MQILKKCNKNLRDAAKLEAASRLRLLDVEGHARRSCSSVSGRLFRSDTTRQQIRFMDTGEERRALVGVNFWLEDVEARAVAEFEKKYNSAVYFVLKNPSDFGFIYSFLYIGLSEDGQEEWQADRQDLREVVESMDGVKFLNPYAFCCQITDAGEICSGEFGRIGIRPAGGGVVRLY